ncbi:MAG: thiol-disulfide oxidoreductase DCC family protein [Aestuariivirgaceae bacterium]
MYDNDQTGPVLIYDGDCPFCSSYVQLVRLRETLGTIELVNARGSPEIVKDLADRNMHLDDGMVLVMNGEFYHGSDCVHHLALLGTSSNLFNRINKLIFERKWLAAILYPVLRACRNLSLKGLGIGKIDSAR